MIYIINVDVFIENLELIKLKGEKIKKPEFSDIFLTEKEFKLYKKLCYEEIEKELGPKFIDKSNQRKTNYEIYFQIISDE